MSSLLPPSAVEIQLGVYVEPQAIADFPRQLAEEFKVIPLRRLGKGIILAASRDLSTEETKALVDRLGKPVCTLACHVPEIEAVIEGLYSGRTESRRIGEVLTDEKLITQEDLQKALERQQVVPKKLGEILVDLGVISQDELLKVLSNHERESNPAILPSLFLDPKLTQAVPEATARRYRVLPLLRNLDELILAAGHHLTQEEVLELESLTRLQIRTVSVVEEELSKAIESAYGRLRKRRLKDLKLGEILMEENLIAQNQLDLALAEQKKAGRKLGEILIERGFVSEDAVLRAVAGKLGCEYRRFATADIDLDLSRYLPRRFAEQNNVLMLWRNSATHDVAVAMADPADLNLRDILEGILGPHGLKMQPVLASPSNIQAGVSFVYQSKGLIEADEEMETIRSKESEDLVLSIEMPEIKRIINQLLYSAVTEGVSDIHIENLENAVHVRFRIDGVLEDRDTPIGKDNIANVISVLKVDSGLDIAERRRSQDGVFKKRVGKDRFIDFRINVHATPFGEDAVIRILDRDKNLLPLEKLGFAASTLQTYMRLVENPQGLILFTGPTGSGKTTTLYSTLSHLNKGNKKIVTAEDPIEYVLQGISQYQVNEAIGNTFEDYARRFLRKDPDIILIGEIRDNKTARSCVNAAMTGHLVFSTLHTNDAVGVVRRLQNLDIAPEMIGDCLLLVVSQRLARRVCSNCREPHMPERRLLQDFFPRGVPPDLSFVRGMGCDACRLKGYRGRVGLYEFWEVKPKTRRLISQGAGEEEIREAALQEGFRVLLADALGKVRDQLTTIEELSRIVSIDQLQRYAPLI